MRATVATGPQTFSSEVVSSASTWSDRWALGLIQRRIAPRRSDSGSGTGSRSGRLTVRRSAPSSSRIAVRSSVGCGIRISISAKPSCSARSRFAAIWWGRSRRPFARWRRRSRVRGGCGSHRTTARPHAKTSITTTTSATSSTGSGSTGKWSTRARIFRRRTSRSRTRSCAKLDLVCRKLALRPGERVVEAGCGWGSLALFMAKRYGVTVRAFNLSTEQIAYARERAKREGLDASRRVRGRRLPQHARASTTCSCRSACSSTSARRTIRRSAP